MKCLQFSLHSGMCITEWLCMHDNILKENVIAHELNDKFSSSWTIVVHTLIHMSVVFICILIYVICLHKVNFYAKYVDKLKLSPFCEVFLSFGFENAYLKLVTLYKTSDCTNVFLDFVAPLKHHKCLLKQAYKTHLTTILENT